MFESLARIFRPAEIKTSVPVVDVAPLPVFVYKPPRPDNSSGLVKGLEAYISQSHTVKEIEEEFTEVGGLLFTIYQEDLATFKKAIERKGTQWGGKMSLLTGMNEQDMVGWVGYDIAEVTDQGIELRAEDYRFSPASKDKEIFAGQLSLDEQSLTRLWWREERTFDKASEARTILLYEADLRLTNNKIVEVSVKQNIHPEKRQRLTEEIVESRLRLPSD